MSEDPDRELSPEAVERLLELGSDLRREEGGGRYRRGRELGRGGMGIVYEAYDTELERTVALKVLHPQIVGDPAVLQRFLREARAAARVRHPGIAAVYDADESCIAMQLVDGPPLSRVPRDDRRRLVRWIRDAARAVHAAHEQGVIHRDLKPQNLLVEGERVVVSDFGLAKDAGSKSSLSLSGAVLGTPAYMAPEQARGEEVDPRTDVYGLGATLYDLLVGRPPFQAPDALRLLHAVVEEPVPSPRRSGVSLPRDLELIVLKCLRKEKERRYASAQALAEDLDRWLEGRPVEAQPSSVGYRLRKFLGRRRGVVGVGAAGLLISLVLLGFWLSAQGRRQAAEDAIALSQRVEALMIDAELHDRLGEKDLRFRRLAEAEAACRDFLVRQEAAEAWLLLGRVLRARQQEDAALVALERAQREDPALHEAWFWSGLLRAEQVSQRRAWRLAEPGAERGWGEGRSRAIDELSVLEREPLSVLQVEQQYGRALLAMLRDDSSVEVLRLLDEVLRIDGKHGAARVAKARRALFEGDGSEAWFEAMQAMDLARGFAAAYLTAPGEDDRPDDAEANAQLGDTLVRRARRCRGAGDREGALQAWSEAVAAYDAALSLRPGMAEVSASRGAAGLQRARVLDQLGRAAEAERHATSTLAELDAAVERHPDSASILVERAMALSWLEERAARRGNPFAAAAAQRRAEEDLRRAIECAPRQGRALGERALRRLRRGEEAAWEELEAALGRQLDARTRARFEAILAARDPSLGRLSDESDD